MNKARIACAADINAVSKLYDNITMHLEDNVNYAGWHKGVYPVRNTALQHLAQGKLCLYEVDGEIAGSIALNHSHATGYNDAAWQIDSPDDEIYFMHTLAVCPEHLHMGIGRQLIQMCEDIARDDNMRALRLDASSENTPALALYKSCGFVHIDTIDIEYDGCVLPNYRLYEKLIQV